MGEGITTSMDASSGSGDLRLIMKLTILGRLGAIQGKQIINLEELMRIETLDGKSFSLYTNADRLEQEMKMLAPEDSEFIHDFAEAIIRFASLRMPVDKNPELYTAVDYLKNGQVRFHHAEFQ